MKADIANSRTFAWLLSIVMLLTTTAPPVWTHCHQGCSLGHERCCMDRQTTRADDDTCCSAEHRCDGTGRHCLAIDCSRNVSHYHLAWLGMTAKVPAEKQSRQPNDQSQYAAILHKAFVPLKVPDSSLRIASPVDLKACDVIGHVVPKMQDRTDLPPDTLLCDVARRERTGVLVV